MGSLYNICIWGYSLLLNVRQCKTNDSVVHPKQKRLCNDSDFAALSAAVSRLRANRLRSDCDSAMFESLYKKGLDKLERQENRRKELLRQQKLKRAQQQDESRAHHEIKTERKNTICIKRKNDLLDIIQLQTSEWFRQKPDDLADWLLVPCPKGQRCIVVAEKGKTKMFSKNKKYCMTFSSFLPGGGRYKLDGDYCMMDCIFNAESDTFYVLDALYYIIPLIECDSEFRFFWLKSKFFEMDALDHKYNNDVKKFQLLENYDIANEDTLAAVLNKYPLWPENQPELDGFLFYHKSSHYVFGETPLVCWLFPFMLPDLLELPVSSVYKPPYNYCKQNPWQFMDEFDKAISLKRSKNKSRNESNQHNFNDVELLLTAEKMLEMDDT